MADDQPAAITEPLNLKDGFGLGLSVGYTLATGNLYTEMSSFHSAAERLLGRPILTHEFADTATWDALRAAFEEEALDAFSA